MEKKLIYRINKGNIFGRSSVEAVKSHEKALDCVRRGVPVICRIGRRILPHRDSYIIWYGTEKVNAVIAPMSLEKEELRRIPLSELISRVKTYWCIDIDDGGRGL